MNNEYNHSKLNSNIVSNSSLTTMNYTIYEMEAQKSSTTFRTALVRRHKIKITFNDENKDSKPSCGLKIGGKK